MSRLTIGWEYLTGYAVATDPASRERAEWPPHPARVFMALAAAWFESDRDFAQRDALRWLESLGEPELEAPPSDKVSKRANVDVYVPVNDKAGPSPAALQSAPTLTRNRQPRVFPRVYVGNATCFLHWPHVDRRDQRIEALDGLCRQVTRIGHSSSLVRMWAAAGENNNQTHGTRFVVDEILARFHLRRISPGFLDTLVDNYGEEPRRRKDTLNNNIAALKQEHKTINGRGARQRKATLKAEIKEKEAERDALSAPAPVRPEVGLWSGYREVAPAEPTVRHSYFDTDCLVLVRDAGPELPLTSTLPVTDALRGAVMHHGGIQPVPQWVSGHEPDGKPSASNTGHLACIPLPFVGHEHADGHLLGVGLVFPRGVDRRERGKVLGPLLVDGTGQPAGVTLKLGRIGTWTVRKSSWEEQRHSLQPEHWTAAPFGAQTWASATPVVLDRFPKSSRSTNHRAWRREVADIIGLACERIGLPRPQWVDISTTSWLLGSPRAFAKTQRLRGSPKSSHHQATRLGDGFPPYAIKNGNAAKPQVHVRLHFGEPVLGPVLIGAGRFRGYGLCKPCKEIKS